MSEWSACYVVLFATAVTTELKNPPDFSWRAEIVFVFSFAPGLDSCVNTKMWRHAELSFDGLICTSDYDFCFLSHAFMFGVILLDM
jgi:hypothetical protein